MKRLIVYDLDGTLVDTREDITCSVNHMLTEFGRKPLSVEEVLRCVGRGMQKLIEGCLDTTEEEEVLRALKIYEAHYEKHMLDSSCLYPKAWDVLDYLKNHYQVVLTNKPNPYSLEILKGLSVDHFFMDVIAGDSVYPKKPDPSGIRSVMRRTAVGPGQVLLIGDSPIDIETGRRCGVRTIGLTHGFAQVNELTESKPDYLLDDFGSFLNLIKKWGW